MSEDNNKEFDDAVSDVEFIAREMWELGYDTGVKKCSITLQKLIELGPENVVRGKTLPQILSEYTLDEIGHLINIYEAYDFNTYCCDCIHFPICMQHTGIKRFSIICGLFRKDNT